MTCMLTRPELIDDWRRRLSTAEEGFVRTSSLRWLAKMQARLYRFLLSCYGDANWRADAPRATCDSDDPADPAISLAEKKPPKPVETMRKVLTSLTQAQEHPAAAGPLRDGLRASDWVVAFSGEKTSAMRVVALLRQEGIPVRRLVQGGCHIVEVAAGVRGKALQWIEDHRDKLMRRTLSPYIPQRSCPRWLKTTAALFLSLLAGLTLAACFAPALADGSGTYRWSEFSQSPIFYAGVWMGCTLMFLGLISIDDLARLVADRILGTRRN